ncbi:hypothetical protein BN1723_006817, partial [Verticillium longisporum]
MSSISMSQPHFNESIREVDKSSWLILNTYLFTRSSSPPPEEVPADQVAEICNRLAAWKGDIIGGVDRRQLLERYLVKGNTKMTDALSPQQLLKNCTEMAMDVSTLVFYHCDLGPKNILVDVSTGSLGIIDWELAGYVPIEWVRTKFRLSAGMDFSHENEDSKRDWRRSVAQHLEKMGYGRCCGCMAEVSGQQVDSD